MPSSKWFAHPLIDNDKGDEHRAIDTVAGIDVVLELYAVDSDGNEVEDPRRSDRELKRLRRGQRRLSRKKGSRNWNKHRMVAART